MPNDTAITLDDFWRGNVSLANLTAQLLTERTDDPASVWAGETYGGHLEALSARFAKELVQREAERLVSVVTAEAAVVSVEAEALVVATAHGELTVTNRGAFYPWQS